MSTALCDRPEHVAQLCRRLDLGRPQTGLSPVPGGFNHRVWRLRTDRGDYAVKQLAPDTDLDDPAVVARYDLTETVAARFAERGIGALAALSCAGSYLQLLGGEGYLVYPWTEAVALDEGQVSPPHALAVAGLLARMHGADLQVPGLEPAPADPPGDAAIRKLVAAVAARHLRAAPLLRDKLAVLLRIARRHRDALPVLARRRVVSHGDLDQKNVLWDRAGCPVLIDWESAQRLNPTYEAVLEALDWSGITATFDMDLCRRFMTAYREAGGAIEADAIEAALYCVAGEWLDWLVYNLGRIVNLDDDAQRAAGEEQVAFSLPVILRVDDLAPRLAAELTQQAAAAAPSA